MNLKEHKGIICAFIATFAAFLCRQLAMQSEGLVDISFSVIRALIYIALFTAWGFSIRKRIIQPQVKRYITAIAAFMVLWMTIRTIRFLFTDDPEALRYLWYMYYIPMMLIPLLALFVAMSLGRPENYRLPRFTRFLYIPAVLIALMVFTNDLHQFVFVFPEGAAVWGNDYTYNIGYFLAAGWAVVCALAALILMLLKCRVPGSRKPAMMPFITVGFALIYCIMYVFQFPWLRIIAGDMTAVFCLFFAAVLESCIYSRLIQTNTGYGELFETSTIGAQIVDRSYKVRYASSGAGRIPEATMKLAEKGCVSIDKNTLLNSSEICGGHVLWQEDISDITLLLEKLEENRRTIEENNYIEEENYRTRVKINAVKEQNYLLERLKRSTFRQISMVDDLLMMYKSESDSAKKKKILVKIAVIGAYIKRRGNLVFIEEKTEMTDIAELEACLNESFAGLKLMDVDCAADIPQGFRIKVKDAANVYDFFESVIEASLSDIHSVWIKGRKNENGMTVYMEIESGIILSKIQRPGISCSFEDSVWRFTIDIREADAI